MKIGAATYSFLWEETAESIINLMHKNGFKGVELCISAPMFNLSQFRPGMYKELKKRLDNYGMKVVNVLVPSLDVNLASTVPEMRKMSVDQYKRLADLGVELESEMMMIFPGRTNLLCPPKHEVVYGHCLEGIKAVLDYTRDTDMVVGIETMPVPFVGTVDELKKLVQDLNDPRAGIVYDAANVYPLEDPAAKLKDVKDYVKLLHLSDTKKSPITHDALGNGTVDYKAFIEAAVEIGYDGYIILEIVNDGGIEVFVESAKLMESTGVKFGR